MLVFTITGVIFLITGFSDIIMKARVTRSFAM